MLCEEIYLEILFHHRGKKTAIVSENICLMERNSADIFLSKLSPGIFVIKVKWIAIIFGGIKLPFWAQ